ncbi:hypothetical protein [Methylocystis suflitae]|uniref:hypothetical protein n=1 Tax=Methylocystis suflitae TaxID=2951405 RepID=UPI00210CA9F3|nr:hypothetical protein [Methylocystis suflitae]MCQ4188047.1 hypothetical protein [Methylocystis suflitae]
MSAPGTILNDDDQDYAWAVGGSICLSSTPQRQIVVAASRPRNTVVPQENRREIDDNLECGSLAEPHLRGGAEAERWLASHQEARS